MNRPGFSAHSATSRTAFAFVSSSYLLGINATFPIIEVCIKPGMVHDDMLVSAALDELRHSGGWVKVIGDFFDLEGRFSANFTTEALRQTALEVHEAGGRITMHAMIPDSIQQAIEAGFDGVEHGSIVEEGRLQRWRLGASRGHPRL